MKTLPVAVQVYSVRDDAERDFKGTMQKIKDMGYDGVELAGLYGMKPAEVKAILEEVASFRFPHTFRSRSSKPTSKARSHSTRRSACSTLPSRI